MKLLNTPVRAEWVDYNRHMSDFRYGQVFGDAMEALFRRVGVDEAYRAAGHTYYTVETHIRHLGEAKAGESLHVTVQILNVDEKRLHVFLRMSRASDGGEIATAEQMHLHVDTAVAKSVAARPAVLEELTTIFAAHQALPKPTTAGGGIGGPR